MVNQRTRILLIEDDEAEQFLIKECLRDSGMQFSLDWAERLGTGLEKLRTGEYDVVLSDLSLPDSRGLETINAIRDCDPSIAVVVLTTLKDLQVETEALTTGAQDYVVKSETTPHSLERSIHHAIQRQQSLVEKQQLVAELRLKTEALADHTKLLRRKNRHLRNLYDTSRRFVDNVSHEFRTPLTVIKEYVSLIRDGLAGDLNAEQQQMLDVVADRAGDLNNMVDDMLDISRLEAGMLGLERRACRLSNIVSHIRPSLEKKAEIKQVDLEFAVSHDLPEIFCDGEKNGRVLINLTVNAIKFCGQPGKVAIRAVADNAGENVVVSVVDNGAGISPENLELIFKRFKQLGENPRGSTKGFGLGLNIAKELVDLNLGELHVESKLGEGTIFSFTVPVAEPRSIMDHYLHRLSRLRGASKTLSLVWVAVDPSCGDALTDDVGKFLSLNVRRSDLVFRGDQARWFLATDCQPADVVNLCRRLDEERSKVNRNRLGAPLPELATVVLGSWPAATGTEAIIEAITERQSEAERAFDWPSFARRSVAEEVLLGT